MYSGLISQVLSLIVSWIYSSHRFKFKIDSNLKYVINQDRKKYSH